MSGIPIGVRYRARHRDRFFHRYSCIHCGFEVEVVVTGVGTGHGMSLLFIDNEAAAGRAEMRASRDAAKDAKQNLKLWPCPRCGRRDSTAFMRKSGLQLCGIAAVLFVLGAGLSRGPDPSIAWCSWTAGVVVPWMVYRFVIWPKWMRAGAAVMTREDYEAATGAPVHGDDAASGEPLVHPSSRPRVEADTDQGGRHARAYLETRSSGRTASPLTLVLLIIVVVAVLAALAR